MQLMRDHNYYHHRLRHASRDRVTCSSLSRRGAVFSLLTITTVSATNITTSWANFYEKSGFDNDEMRGKTRSSEVSYSDPGLVNRDIVKHHWIANDTTRISHNKGAALAAPIEDQEITSPETIELDDKSSNEMRPSLDDMTKTSDNESGLTARTPLSSESASEGAVAPNGSNGNISKNNNGSGEDVKVKKKPSLAELEKVGHASIYILYLSTELLLLIDDSPCLSFICFLCLTYCIE